MAGFSALRADELHSPSLHPLHRWRNALLAGGSYLFLSVGMWWHVWSDHPTSTSICGCGDTSLFTWFIEWPAYAISHGLNPLYSNAMGYPHGINLLANTGMLAVGVTLLPITWVFGPSPPFGLPFMGGG